MKFLSTLVFFLAIAASEKSDKSDKASATDAPAAATDAPATATDAPVTDAAATGVPTGAPATESAGKGDIKGGSTCGKILGQSGKIKVGKCSGEVLDQQDPGLVTITMDAVGEKDAGGSPLTKKWFNSFAPLDFTFEAIQEVSVNGIAASRLDFFAEVTKNPVGKLGVIKVSTHFFSENGQISNADGQEKFNVTAGSMKFAVTVEDWQFCDAVSGKGADDDGKNCDAVGEFVDLEISVKSAGGSSKSKEGSNSTIDLGGSATMDLSSWVKYGDTWTTMAEGYPKVEEGLNSFRFAKAAAAGATTMFYDPVVTLAGNGGSTGTGGAGAGDMPADSFSPVLVLPALFLAEL